MSSDIAKIEKKLLKEIREYTFSNKELLNAHHFMFACPIEKNGEAADIIICGLNPGGDPKEDYKKLYNGQPFPTEETSDYDFFVEDDNQTRNGKFYININEIFNKDKQKNITHTEAFFWNSSGVDPESFNKRYGYSFNDNPHWDFCVKMNEELFKAHNPDLIVFLTSNKDYVPNIAKRFDLKEINSFKLPRKRGATRVYHYEYQGSTPVVFVPHPTGGYHLSAAEKDAIKQYLKRAGLI